MADNRTLRQKLEAMASQDASPAEAEVARAMLENMAGLRTGNETRRVLTREAVLTSPDRVTGTRREVAVRFPSGRWMQMYADEVNWAAVVKYGLSTRTVT